MVKNVAFLKNLKFVKMFLLALIRVHLTLWHLSLSANIIYTISDTFDLLFPNQRTHGIRQLEVSHNRLETLYGNVERASDRQ